MRSPRVDTKEQAVKVMQAATFHVDPPTHIGLTQSDLVFFVDIVEEFARARWTKHALTVAGYLAKAMNDLVDNQTDLRRDGFTSTNARGTEVANPLVSVCQGLASQILSFRRTLALNASSEGKLSAINRQAEIQRGQEADNPLADDDDNLLARPRSVN